MRQKYNCPDCGKETIREGLCKDCRLAYATATEFEGLGEDAVSVDIIESEEEEDE